MAKEDIQDTYVILQTADTVHKGHTYLTPSTDLITHNPGSSHKVACMLYNMLHGFEETWKV